MKWTAKIGTFTARKCCFCEYWTGARPEPVPKSIGMFTYDTNTRGGCRHPSYINRTISAGATCSKFEAYPHLH